ncbi:ferredoxin [Elusimicrobium simillimum]|uniref:EFR1 family ferrodoxin n=1 Tax=Elusimicrobium simillimum TaxID=3143438 RepID=UPI003C6FB3AD
MKINKVTAVYFSATGGTKDYAKHLAQMFHKKYREINLADYNTRTRHFTFDADELVVIAAPVYAGRLPAVDGGLFKNLDAHNSPAVFMVTYGNREYEDALLELKNECEKRGFHAVGAAAVVAPHSFSVKIAAGRPDEADITALSDFADKVKETLEADDFLTKFIKVNGTLPYREHSKIPFAPKGGGKCDSCGTCVKICPVQAIEKETPRVTDAAKCIACYACVKACPRHTRGMKSLAFWLAIKKMESKLTKIRKEPEFFYI